MPPLSLFTGPLWPLPLLRPLILPQRRSLALPLPQTAALRWCASHRMSGQITVIEVFLLSSPPTSWEELSLRHRDFNKVYICMGNFFERQR